MAEHPTDEPTIQPLPSGAERRLNRALERAASVLTSVVALLLIAFVVITLLGVVVDAVRSLSSRAGLVETAVHGVDAAFLAIILLELAHTTLARGGIGRQLQEFLVIGITSGVRSGLEVVAGAHDTSSRDVVVNLAINSVGVLVLVGAFWLVRKRFHAERTAGGG